MANKEIKISLRTDIKDGSKLASFMKELQLIADKLSKTVGNFSIGGGPTAPGGQLTGNAAAIRQAAGTQSPLTKQLVDNKRAMADMGREIDVVARKFTNLGRAASQAGMGASWVNQFSSAGRTAFPPTSGVMSARGMTPLPGGSFGGGGPWTPTGPGGGAGGPGGFAGFQQTGLGSLLTGQLARMIGWGTVIANAKEAFFGAPQREIEWAQQGGVNTAQGNAAIGGLGARALGGDVMPGIGLMRAMGRGRGVTGFTSGDLQTIMNATPEAAARLAESKGLNLNFVKGLTQAGLGLTGQARAAAVKQKMAEMIQVGMQQDPIANQRIQMAQQLAPGMVGFARRFGRDFNAGAALGANLDPQQVQATVSGVLSALGSGTNIGKVTQLAIRATRLGISDPAIQAIIQAQEIGGGNLMNRLLRSGMSRPMMGMVGQAAAQAGEQSMLRLNSEILGRGFMAMGAGTDTKTLQQLQAGRGFLNQMTTGQLDPYQQTMNYAIAAQRGRSIYTTQTLGSMKYDDLLNAAYSKEGPTREQRAAGVTRESAKAQLAGEVNSIANRLVREKDVVAPAGIEAVLRARQEEGGVFGTIERLRGMGKKGEEQLGTLSAGLSMISGGELGSKIAEFLGGGIAPGKGGAEAGETQGRFATALSTTFAGMKEFIRDSNSMVMALKDADAAARTLPHLLEGFQTMLEATDADKALLASTSLMGVGKAMGDIAEKGPDAVNVLKSIQDFIAGVAAAQEKAHPAALQGHYGGLDVTRKDLPGSKITRPAARIGKKIGPHERSTTEFE